MSLWLSLLIIVISFYVMSEVVDKYFIKSLDNISHWLKLPESVAGATLLALGTSAPEISTALIALFLEEANPATGIGTIVGSAIFQILVVIGFAAVVRTCYLNWRPVIRDSVFYALSVLLLIFFIQDNKITLIEGACFVGFYLVYLFILYLWSRYVKEESHPRNFDPEVPHPYTEVEKEVKKNSNPKHNPFYIIRTTINYPIHILLGLIPDVEKKPQWTVPVFIISLGIIGYACYWLVVAAECFATIMRIPTAIVALTILAGGSSIPEMISSAIVSRQGRGDMAIANAIGSNIFDILISLGLPVLIYILIKGEDLEDLGGDGIRSSVMLLFGSLALVVFLLILLRFRAN
ncbi:MAG: calcium/sodium antiporter, partial [Bacteroidota bacterium]